MRDHYRAFFGLQQEPFGTTVPLKHILETPDIISVKERIDYVVRLGAVGLVTGDIGSGKSTALKYAAAGFHPSEYRLIHLTASSGSILEIYRQMLCELGMDTAGTSRAIMTQKIKKDILELMQGKKMKTVLIIDEAVSSAAGGPGGDPHPLFTPSGCLPARHPRGPIQPRRQTDVPVILAAGITNRCQKPSGGGPS